MGTVSLKFEDGVPLAVLVTVDAPATTRGLAVVSGISVDVLLTANSRWVCAGNTHHTMHNSPFAL